MKNCICHKSFSMFQAKVFFAYRKKNVSKCLENYRNFVWISFGKILPSVKWKTIFGRECCRWLILVGNLLNWLLHLYIHILVGFVWCVLSVRDASFYFTLQFQRWIIYLVQQRKKVKRKGKKSNLSWEECDRNGIASVR